VENIRFSSLFSSLFLFLDRYFRKEPRREKKRRKEKSDVTVYQKELMSPAIPYKSLAVSFQDCPPCVA
jgi:hypothetical protein